jgi:hypothetical protein
MLDLLIREAEALALPAYDLVPATSGEEVAAYWGGSRNDLPKKLVGAYKSRQHVLSVDSALWESLGLVGRGPFALVLDTTRDDSEQAHTIPVSSGSLTSITFDGATPLKAVRSLSLPPLEAIALYGSPAVDTWLKAYGLNRWDYSGLIGKEEEAYRSYFYERSPLMSEAPPYARVGGWHLLWSDDDFYIPREMRLMLWTFECSEPWYEVFLTPLNNLLVKERIT